MNLSRLTDSIRRKGAAFAALWTILSLQALTNMGCDNPAGVDTVPPVIEIYSPFSNDTVVYGKNIINYQASDNQGLKSFHVFIDKVYKKSFQVSEGKLPEISMDVDSAMIGKRISYYVSAVDVSNNAVMSAEHTNILVIDTKNLPPAPYDLVLTKITTRTFNISWKDSAKFKNSLALWRKPGLTGTYTLIRQLGNSAFNVNDSIPDPGIVYFYKISSTNQIGTTFSTEVNTQGGSGGFLGPSELTATALGKNKIALKWKDNTTNENLFKVERKDYGVFSVIAILPANSTYYLDSANGLAQGREYTYRVKAFTDRDSAWSNEVTVATFPYELLAPTNLTAAKTATSHIKLNWTNVSASWSFSVSIERVTYPSTTFQVIGSVSSTVSSFEDSLITAPNLYTYRVRCTDGTYSSEYSNTAQINFVISLLPPTNLTAAAVGGKIVKLNWTDNSNNESFFRVERKQSWTEYGLVALLPANTTNYSDASSSLAYSSTYTYRIKAINSTDSAVSNEAVVTTASHDFPAPTEVTVLQTSPTTVRVVWKNNFPDQSVFVQIERKSLTNPDYQIIAPWLTSIWPNTYGTYDDNTVVSPNTYTYRLRITDGTFYSEYSAEKTIALSTVLMPPSNLTGFALGGPKISLSWTDNSSNELYFKIERKLTSASTFGVVAQVPANTTTYIDNSSGLVLNTSYVYRIKAFSYNDSAVSNEAQISTPPHLFPAPTEIALYKMGASNVRLVWRNNYPDPFITVTIERKSLSNPTYSVIAQNIATFNIVMGTFDDNSAYSPNTYTYRMRITDGTFYSEYSEEKSIAMPIPLSAPSNLTAQVFGNGKVILDWVDNSVNESYFSIERRVAAAVTFEKIGQVPANTTTYTDTALLSNTTFVYRIKAVTATDSALSNEAQVTTPLHIYPPPTDISLFNLGGGAVRISWKNNYPDVSVTVQIERKSTTSPNFLLVADNIGTFNQPYGNYTDNNAPGPNTYYYRLRITDGTFYSDYSVTATITIP